MTSESKATGGQDLTKCREDVLKPELLLGSKSVPSPEMLRE